METGEWVLLAVVLVLTVMTERGYPGDFERHVDVISVDHPNVVENYRLAHATRDRALGEGRTSTEELRETLLHYRSLFDELLGGDDDEVVTGEAEARERGSAR